MSTFQCNHPDTSLPIYAIYRNSEDGNRWSYQLFDTRFPASSMETHYDKIQPKMQALLGKTAFPVQCSTDSAKDKVDWLNRADADPSIALSVPLPRKAIIR
jgi:hypothetical protein